MIIRRRVLTLCVTAQVRIFPTEDTWNNYGSLLDFGSSNNLVMLGHTDTMMMMMMMMMAGSARAPLPAVHREAAEQDSAEAGPGRGGQAQQQAPRLPADAGGAQVGSVDNRSWPDAFNKEKVLVGAFSNILRAFAKFRCYHKPPPQREQPVCGQQ